mmetsp:Transcript_19967/g.41878  ORF Transcript_19967/g.41878 Transcript_19967/m.41878 type:complete len:252 (-) Transcript_19967:109-864(-)
MNDEQHLHGRPGLGCQDALMIYPRQANAFQSTISPAFRRHGPDVQSSSLSDLSQNDTEQSIDEPSDNWCSAGNADTLESHYTFSVLALEAYRLWESSNFASICSSATTVAPATICADPAVSAAISLGLAPSFDFMRPIIPTAMPDYSLRHPYDWSPVRHPGDFMEGGQYSPSRQDSAAPVDSSPLPSLSVGSGYALDAGHRWQEPSCLGGENRQPGSTRPHKPDAVGSQELEEYSLGSGYPAMYHSPGYPI